MPASTDRAAPAGHGEVARARLALDAVQGHVYEYDLQGGTLWRGEGITELLGYPADAVPQTLEWWRSHIPSEDLARLDAEARAAVARGDTMLCNEHRVRHRDGREIWVQGNMQLQYAPDGSLARIVGCTLNVDARKRAELALQEHARRQELLLETSEALIASGVDELSLARTLFERLAGPLPADLSLNYRLDEAGETLELVAAFGLDEAQLAPFRRLGLHGSFCGLVARTRQPLQADGERMQADPLAEALRALGVQAYACQPLLARDGRLLGTLSYGSRRRTRFDPGEVQFLRTLSHFVALGWERFAAERASRESAARLRLAFEVAALAEFEIDLLAWTAQHSDALCAIAGVSREQAQALPTNAFIDPADEPALRTRLASRIARGEREFTTDYRVRRPDGEIRWVESRCRIEYDAAGTARRLVGVSLDITDRKLAARALEQSEQRYRLAMQAVDGYVYEWDRERDLLTQSEGYAILVGEPLDRTRPVREAWCERIHPDDRAAAMRRWQAALEGSEARVENEYRLRVAGGRHRWVLDRALLLRDAAGCTVRVVGSVCDITQRRDAEQALRDADRHKDEFLAMLAHELRNPLAPICHVTRLLEAEAPAGSPLQRPVGVLARQSAQLSRLVDDLLDVSRIARGHVDLRREPLAVPDLVQQALETVHALVAEKAHRLQVRHAGPSAWVVGDRARLVQALGNLLHNAAKYTDAGGEIEIEVCTDAAEVEIAVRDGGTGIAPELLPQVFELFVQGARTLDRAQGGLGIGLSVVRRLVQMHGGSVSAASAGAGRGACFTVRLPRAAEPAGTAPPGSPAAVAARRILVVDDNVDAAEMLAALLRLDGHEVTAVFDPEAALAHAARLPPDVVLLDIGLPGMDGYEVAQRLRRGCSGRVPHLVALTGYGQAGDRARSRAAGFDAHLVKPADPLELARVLAAADAAAPGG